MFISPLKATEQKIVNWITRLLIQGLTPKPLKLTSYKNLEVNIRSQINLYKRACKYIWKLAFKTKLTLRLLKVTFKSKFSNQVLTNQNLPNDVLQNSIPSINIKLINFLILSIWVVFNSHWEALVAVGFLVKTFNWNFT